MKQNGFKTSFGGVDKKTPGARIIFSLPIDAEDYEYLSRSSYCVSGGSFFMNVPGKTQLQYNN
jgi:hypothetical protein